MEPPPNVRRHKFDVPKLLELVKITRGVPLPVPAHQGDDNDGDQISDAGQGRVASVTPVSDNQGDNNDGPQISDASRGRVALVTTRQREADSDTVTGRPHELYGYQTWGGRRVDWRQKTPEDHRLDSAPRGRCPRLAHYRFSEQEERKEVGEEIRQEVGEEVRKEVRKEVREEVREEVRKEVRKEVRWEVRK